MPFTGTPVEAKELIVLAYLHTQFNMSSSIHREGEPDIKIKHITWILMRK
jgi:hypothetical protein